MWMIQTLLSRKKAKLPQCCMDGHAIQPFDDPEAIPQSQSFGALLPPQPIAPQGCVTEATTSSTSRPLSIEAATLQAHVDPLVKDGCKRTIRAGKAAGPRWAPMKDGKEPCNTKKGRKGTQLRTILSERWVGSAQDPPSGLGLPTSQAHHYFGAFAKVPAFTQLPTKDQLA